MGVVSDAELVSASLAGSSVAFAVLVTRHRERARRVARRLLGDEHEAEDVAQEALLQAYVGLTALRDRDRFGSWLGAIAANLARMRLRRQDRDPVPLGDLRDRPAEGLDGGAGLLRATRAALDALPRGEREAILACDVLGLSREEAGTELGCSAAAVRVRLHRGRRRLQERLREHGPMTRQKEGREMIEVEVQQILSRFGEDGQEAEVEQLVGRVQTVVLLAEKDGDRVLPIWIGAQEAGALVMQLAGEETPRPMSADLMARLVEALGGRVERVVVSCLREETFFASIAVAGAEGRKEVDARPSDALNLARRAGAPIFVDDAVLEQAGVAADGLEERLDREEARFTGAAASGTWRPVSPETVRGWWLLRPPVRREREEER